MKILALDCETTGLDSTKHQIIEIGAVLWDTERHKHLKMFSEYIYCEEIPPEITELTGIDSYLTKHSSVKQDYALLTLKSIAEEAEYYMAHNAPFDHGFIKAAINNEGIEWPELPWIDSRTDIPYHKDKGKGNLTLICANHGFLNPFPHSALFDVISICKILSCYSWANDEIIRRMNSTSIEVKAHVSYDERDKAKEAGFHWQPDQKIWTKNFKSCDYETVKFDFDVSVNKVLPRLSLV